MKAICKDLAINVSYIKIKQLIEQNLVSINFMPDSWFHIYNRGNNSEPIFFEPDNYLYFLKKVQKYWLNDVKIIAYCLMPNHFHFLIYTTKNYVKGSLNNAIAVTLRSYTRAINNRLGRTGSLFQEGTKAKLLYSPGDSKSPGESPQADDYYPLICLHYIHQNPLRARLVQNLEDWEFSSYKDYAGLRNGTLPATRLGFKLFNFKNRNDFIRRSKQAMDPSLAPFTG